MSAYQRAQTVLHTVPAYLEISPAKCSPARETLQGTAGTQQRWSLLHSKVNTLKEGPTETILLCQHISAAYVQKKVQVSPALRWYGVT